MAISRSFTSRSKRNNLNNSVDDTAPMPNLLTKASLRSFDRSKISSPVLLSTTNVDTINAPTIEAAQKLRKVSSISSASSRSSDKDSDVSSTSPRSRGTSITDNSSVGSSPPSPKPSDGSSYFITTKSTPPAPRRAASSADIKRRAASFEQSTPLLPVRAPSHSKVAHEQLARKRSLQTLHTWQEPARSVPSSNAAPTPLGRETRASRDIFNHRQLEKHAHPFGKELEQLDEIAEEFGGAVRDAEREADVSFMRQHRLAKFSATDYLRDLEPIFNHFFRPIVVKATSPPSAGWI